MFNPSTLRPHAHIIYIQLFQYKPHIFPIRGSGLGPGGRFGFFFNALYSNIPPTTIAVEPRAK